MKADGESKLIVDYCVTDASVHDSQVLFDLVGKENLFGDSAYAAEEFECRLKSMDIASYIHEKGRHGSPLSEAQKGPNSLKSRICCLVEHTFGYIENSMGGPELRYIGMARNAAGIELCNLAYNMKHYVYLCRSGECAA